MKKRIWKQRIENRMLHYGISLVLLALVAVVLVILTVMEIPEKKSVTLLRAGSYYKAYVPKDFPSGGNRDLSVETDGGAHLLFRVTGRAEEPLHQVWLLQPDDSVSVSASFGQNTLIQGHVFTRNIKLIKLVFRRGE